MKTITFEILSQREQLISTINYKQINTKILQYKILPAVRANKDEIEYTGNTSQSAGTPPLNTEWLFPATEKYSKIPQNVYIVQYSGNSKTKIKEYTFLLMLKGVSLSRTKVYLYSKAHSNAKVKQ